MVKILITNATIITMSIKGKLVYRDGYLYLDRGIVKAIGSGEVPDEYQYAEYLINGKGRIVLPGLASGFTLITPYILRYDVINLNDRKINDLLSIVSRDDVYHIAVLAFTEMVKRGITATLVIDTYLDSIARAADSVGIRAILAPGFNCMYTQDEPEHMLRLIINRYHGKSPNIHAAIAACDQEKLKDIVNLASTYNVHPFLLSKNLNSSSVDYLKNIKNSLTLLNNLNEEIIPNVKRVYTEEFLKFWKPPAGLGIGVKPSYNINDIMKLLLTHGADVFDVLASGTIWGYEALGLNFNNSIEVGKPADIIILNASEPPGWPTPKKVESLLRAVIEGAIPIETVIIADNIVIDYNEIVTVGSEIMRKATSRLSEILKNI